MTNDFEGQAGLVTGAAGGIGRASARAFAKRGAKVLVCDVDVAGGEETVRLIRGEGGTADFMKCDVSDEAAVIAMVAAVQEKFGRLDFAHNNAGIIGSPGLLGEYERADWDRVISVNLTSVFLCMRYELQVMVEGGGGVIVNTSSSAGIAGQPQMPAYIASKHGVAGLTRSAALDYASKGIRVNALCPGAIRTPMMTDSVNRGLITEEAASATTPIGRLAEPEEVAEAAVWLCSPASSYINGVLLPVDGGADSAA